MSSTNFKVRFDCGDDIDSDILITTLLGINSTILEINKKLYPKNKIQIRIKALERGSFLIFLGIHAPDIIRFFKDYSSLTNNLLSTLVNIFNLKKHLQGEKSKFKEIKGNDIHIENVQGDVIIMPTRTYSYCKDPKVDKYTSKIFQKIESSDENIENLEVIDDKGRPLSTFNKSDYRIMAKESPEVIEKKTQKIVKEEVPVIPIKLDLERKENKWNFIYEGNRISAPINDNNFHREINGKRISFRKGDTLIVDLQIYQEFNEDIQAFENKGYEIVKVIKHISGNESKQLEIK